mmetsp:Transcript_825/g.2337  ORF Transcript_825/g.2337 Transcript_825/m.2337 type:complete len:244 (+) Transcript_825:782-1513(+)
MFLLGDLLDQGQAGRDSRVRHRHRSDPPTQFGRPSLGMHLHVISHLVAARLGACRIADQTPALCPDGGLHATVRRCHDAMGTHQQPDPQGHALASRRAGDVRVRSSGSSHVGEHTGNAGRHDRVVHARFGAVLPHEEGDDLVQGCTALSSRQDGRSHVGLGHAFWCLKKSLKKGSGACYKYSNTSSAAVIHTNDDHINGTLPCCTTCGPICRWSPSCVVIVSHTMLYGAGPVEVKRLLSSTES